MSQQIRKSEAGLQTGQKVTLLQNIYHNLVSVIP
jgi:hypothetical protein